MDAIESMLPEPNKPNLSFDAIYKPNHNKHVFTEGNGEYREEQAILIDYIKGFPKESDLMILPVANAVELKGKAGSKAILVKNIYLSCDPYIGIRMKEPNPSSSAFMDAFVPGKVTTSLTYTSTYTHLLIIC